MKEYRPEGWKTIPLWSRICDGKPITSTHEAFEAGASAMLKALRKDAIHIRDKKGWKYLEEIYKEWLYGDEVGHVVFIPEDSEEGME